MQAHSKIQVLFLKDITVLEAICDVLLISKACNLQFRLALSFSTVLCLTLTCTCLLHMQFSVHGYAGIKLWD